MMFPSHLLATLVACALLALVRPVSPKEWLLAIGFGVAIDLDHLLQFPRYVAARGWNDLTPASMLHWGGAWQGFFHTPWALVLIVPACLFFGSLFPAAFWGLHMVQDFVVARHLVHFGSATEWAIVGALAVALLGLLYRDHRLHGAEATLVQHAAARASLLFVR